MEHLPRASRFCFFLKDGVDKDPTADQFNKGENSDDEENSQQDDGRKAKGDNNGDSDLETFSEVTIHLFTVFFVYLLLLPPTFRPLFFSSFLHRVFHLAALLS